MKNLLKTASVALAMMLCSCLDHVYDRLDRLDAEVSDLQTAIAQLKQAVDAVKSVSAVTPLDENKGWEISFSDGTSISVLNGNTSYLMVDKDRYLCYSTDNGRTFVRVLDSMGNPVTEDNMSVRLGTDADDCMVFEFYRTSEPDVVVNSLATFFKSDKSNIIRTITENKSDHTIALTMADGTVFEFNAVSKYPTNIVLLSASPVLLSENSTASVEFRVNPSDATFDCNVESETCEIELDVVGQNTTNKSYVTQPQHFRLSKVEQVYRDGILLEGQYKAYITELEASLSDNARLAAHEYEDYLDVESFIDWWLINEMVYNAEPCHHKSSYMNKDKNGKLKAGPVWDYDWHTFTSSSGFCIKKAIYYDRLFSDAQFVGKVKTRWPTFKAAAEQQPDYIRSRKAELQHSDVMNNRMWPCTSTVNGDNTLPFDEAIDRMISKFENRIAWMDSQISSL